MFRLISPHIRAPLRSLPQALTPPFKLPVNPPYSAPPNPSFSTLPSPFSHSPPLLLQRREDAAAAADEFNRRLLVVQPRLRPEPVLRAKLDEALSLANSLEEQRDGFFDTELWEKELPPHVVVQNPVARSRRADTYFGPGTLDTIKCHLNAVESEGGVDAVFVNTILTGIQQRNLERAWGKPVLDRVGLIIEIFNAHAFTKEAKLQAELASLMYKRTRLVRVRGPDGRYTFGAIGEAEVVSARGRGSAGRGFIGGAGETELQLQRRRIVDRRKQLLEEIKEVRRTRALQRASRKRHGGENGQCMATVAVVGYTNAGKSTLVSALSDSDLYSDDRLFATVDPKLRSVVLPSGRKVLVSDTVGFISDLPVQLVEAFHATLEEVVEADLLVHVLDSSAPNIDEHRETVLQVLKQIGVSEEKLQNMIEVWNKIDLQEEMDADECLDDGEDDDNNDDNNDDILSLGDCKEITGDQQSDCSDGWLLSGDEHESLNEMGWETSNDPQNMLSEDLRKPEKDSHSQTQYVPHVKTSAVMGVGLNELLEIIDKKLKSQNVVERNAIDRKWRPPRTEDSGIAVER
ncbi:GTP-binding protein At3g49725, chloroplastic [Rhododendron vialii]|uniref:GTP-binding protein At3g49725, chloroplastic n=1 Tax=Rhododendron vialii TaxID=182163 RepID=UPI00265F80EB|nr:GTP-binding protein At3g49725, chloroplastic [Rhododendron vialii]